MTGKRILVVEDEFLIALEILSMLEDAGFSGVEHAGTEAEALRLLGSGAWDAVVADANLDGRSAERLTIHLRAQGIPFVVVTGYDRDSLPASIRDAPLIEKPLHGSRLAQTVAKLCGA